MTKTKKALVVNRDLETTIQDKEEANVYAENLVREMDVILDTLSGESDTHKPCSRCKRLGRPFVHPVDHFSVVKKTGKLHSQCRPCRTEQALKWEQKKRHERQLYHRKYRESYNRNNAKARKPLSPTIENTTDLIVAGIKEK